LPLSERIFLNLQENWFSVKLIKSLSISLLMVLFTFFMFLLEVNLLICLLSPYILLLSGLLLPSWAFTIFMPTLRRGDKDIIYLLFLFILIEISYIWFSSIIIKYSFLFGFYFSLYMMGHWTLYIEQRF